MKTPYDDDDEGTPHFFSPTEEVAAPKAKSPEQAFSPMNKAEEAFAGVAGVEVGVIGEPMAIIPRLPPLRLLEYEAKNVKKKTKRDGWNDEMLLLLEEGLLILDFCDPSDDNEYEANTTVQCVPCRDSTSKTTGIIHLRCPFNSEKWVQHESGKRHQQNVQRFIAMAELQAKGKVKSHKQSGMFSFFSLKNANGVVDEEKTVDTNSCRALTAPLTSHGQHSMMPSARWTNTTESISDCCGVFNSYKGEHRVSIGFIKRYIAIDGRRDFTRPPRTSYFALRPHQTSNNN